MPSTLDTLEMTMANFIRCGFSFNFSSVQSAIACVSEYLSNTLGIMAQTASGDIQMPTAPKTMQRKLAQVLIVLLTAD